MYYWLQWEWANFANVTEMTDYWILHSCSAIHGQFLMLCTSLTNSVVLGISPQKSVMPYNPFSFEESIIFPK